MLLSNLDFDLPSELIAQKPLKDRSASRMLVIDRSADSFTDHSFTELPNILQAEDLLVINNTRVFPARLHGALETGAKVEVLLIKQIENNTWEALAKPARRLGLGKTISFGPQLKATVVERTESGHILVSLFADGDLETVIDEVGRTPLPPYIKRGRDSSDTDRGRYQTMFAKERGAIAAPTAGLHFTPEVIASVNRRDISVEEITLHVGYGTFATIRADDLADHRVAEERYELSGDTAEKLTSAKNLGRRIIAVGTTTTRVLETTYCSGLFEAGSGFTDLTITPGYQFRAIDGLITNFHLPKSSLLVLTAVFGGQELVMRSYRHAVAERYRFYSYGDCMLIV